MSWLLLLIAGLISPLQASWQLTDASEVQKYTTVSLTLTNTSSDTIYGQDWCILYSLLALHPTTPDTAQLYEEIIQGTLHRLSPTSHFQPLAPGERRAFPLSYYRVYIMRNSWRPEMFAYIPLTGAHKAEAVAMPFTCLPLPENNPQVWQFTRYMAPNDTVVYATGENLYSYYQSIGDTTTQGLHLLPMPKSIVYAKGTCDIRKARLVSKQNLSLPHEGYRMEISGHHICIVYGDEAGLFYAQQTLQQLMNTNQTIISNCTITDAPEYPYRGFLLDIARNFLPKEAILSILQTMSEIKLNRMQLHFTDDEAWRIEIPSYPQLTEFGAHRRYSGTKDDPLAESTCLYPQYGDAIDNAGAPGSGYLTRSDFIEILRYAKARHIQIIPEVDMPGHMRAAKMAMRPLLSDSTMDSRTYMSAQEFTDCVIDVTSPFAVQFVEQVVSDLQAMYQEADCEMPIFNIGGDEVPKGALTTEEHQTFVDSITAMLARHQLRPAGWEEFAHYCPASRNPLCVYWHHRPKLLTQLIDSGYQVVIARNDRLYMDFSYANHEQEQGSHKVCDEFRIFDWWPEQDLDEEHAAVLPRHIEGVQAQLWGETLRSVPQAEIFIYPKLLGFAERAWNPHTGMIRAELSEHIYGYVLPYYARQGHVVHVPMPGIHVDEVGLITMCSPACGAQIRYTLDGSEPTRESALFTAPFVCPSDVDRSLLRAKSYYMGYESGVVSY